MRLLTIILLGAILSSCSTSKKDEKDDDFKRYLSSLETLQTPVTFDTKNGIYARSKDYDTTLYKKFKHAWAFGPYGKIFENDSVVFTVDITAGDVLVPLIMTFDQRGHKLDSLNPYEKAGSDMGYESYEYVVINDKKEIIVTDSTRTWDLNEKRDDIIEGSDRLTVDTVIYKVDDKGKFRKVVKSASSQHQL
ncbi:MAG TPA: hypothetical protein VFZ33_17685 [Chitinophagaceae bacterium]